MLTRDHRIRYAIQLVISNYKNNMKHEQIGQDHITSNNSRASESAGGDDQFIHFRFGSYYFQLQKMRLWLPWTSCILFLVQNLVELTSGDAKDGIYSHGGNKSERRYYRGTEPSFYMPWGNSDGIKVELPMITFFISSGSLLSVPLSHSEIGLVTGNMMVPGTILLSALHIYSIVKQVASEIPKYGLLMRCH
ncbi:PREDICTED: uncharacterized protein LOC104588445 [Nelumbo nucifera]|uniref:Uncharacterized protein LOC104588445 n=2 Tax=Nelumbo nucifera TaxID=4432 RepID=A0A1U8PYS2_NELNU|nr:PREDICTED: uncharacterized protein LOC104588445 [Nelumbo nucifera]